jgi:hypothetical protein
MVTIIVCVEDAKSLLVLCENCAELCEVDGEVVANRFEAAVQFTYF